MCLEGAAGGGDKVGHHSPMCPHHVYLNALCYNVWTKGGHGHIDSDSYQFCKFTFIMNSYKMNSGPPNILLGRRGRVVFQFFPVPHLFHRLFPGHWAAAAAQAMRRGGEGGFIPLTRKPMVTTSGSQRSAGSRPHGVCVIGLTNFPLPLSALPAVSSPLSWDLPEKQAVGQRGHVG